jgi:stage III sporulation protein AF
MIEWLSHWLKEIILVILLAAFADLLLPNSSLQRYVKFVLSLFIMLAVLSPIIEFIKGDWGSYVSASMERVQQDEQSRSRQMESLDSILETGQELADSRQDEAVRLAESQIEERLAAQLQDRTGRRVEQISVRSRRNDEGFWEIESVSVVFGGAAEAAARADPSSDEASPWIEPVQEMKPVQPIAKIEPVRPVLSGSAGDSEEARMDAAGSPQDPLLQETAEWLKREWNVPEAGIKVEYAGEPAP